MNVSSIRLQKLISEAGICSRREAEELIQKGRVYLNGVKCTTLGTKVIPEQDRVTVDGILIKPRRKLYLALHKPANVSCTCKDPQERTTVLDLPPAEMHHVYPVGRLDYDSEGLLLLTSDGEFCQKITHPSRGVNKIYYVEIQGPIQKDIISKMLHGVKHEGDFLRASGVKILRSNNTRSCLEITLKEGKTREIRRMLDTLGQVVLTLRRIQIGPIKLDKLPLGKWRILTKTEIKLLLEA